MRNPLLSILLALCFFVFLNRTQTLFSQDTTAESSEPKLAETLSEKPSQDEILEQIADWLPETTVMFGKISPLSQWLDHPFKESLVQTEAFKKLWRSPQALQLRSGITVAELTLGLKLDQLAKDLTDQGAFVAIDAESKGIALLLRTPSQEWLADYLDKALELLRRDAKSKGKPDPVQSAEYRGKRGYKFQNGIFAAIGPWMLITNQGDLAKSILDHQAQNNKGLSQASWYREARKNSVDRPDGPKAQLWIDLVSIRQLMNNNDLFRGQAKDFGAELILGGVLSVLANAQVMQACLSIDPQGLELNLQTPSKPEWFTEARQHYVGPGATGHAPNWSPIAGSIATLSTYRNVAEMWLRAGDLFDQNVNEQLAQADNTLTTIFAGKDFGTDILGAIEPQVQLFAAEPNFDPDTLKPAIQLPSFGLIAKLKDPSKLQRELKRTFQSFIGFLNVAGAQQGQPQLELDTIEHQGASIYTAKYILDEDRKYPDGLPIQFNFQPTLAFVQDRVVLCSSVENAKSMLGDNNPTGDLPTQPLQTWLHADVLAIQRLLQTNSNSIIAQNMLEKGNNRLEAKREFDTMMLLLGLAKKVSMSMEFQDQATLRLRLDANLQN